MQLGSYRLRFSYKLFITACIGMLYIMHRIKPYYVSMNQFLHYEILMPRTFLYIAVIFTVGYILDRKKGRNLMSVLLMKRKVLIWKSDAVNSVVCAVLYSVFVTVGLMVINAVKYNSTDCFVNILASGGFVFLQLSVRFILIELAAWMLNSQVPGVAAVIAWGICEAYSPLILLVYKLFYIADDILNYNIKMIIYKLFGLIMVNVILIAIGCIFSDKKEFL